MQGSSFYIIKHHHRLSRDNFLGPLKMLFLLECANTFVIYAWIYLHERLEGNKSSRVVFSSLIEDVLLVFRFWLCIYNHRIGT
jgi:uncharacterized protein (DUF486 family)